MMTTTLFRCQVISRPTNLPLKMNGELLHETHTHTNTEVSEGPTINVLIREDATVQPFELIRTKVAPSPQLF